MAVKCNICKGRVEKDNIYCLSCAFAKGICESCGKRVSDVKMYRQSDIDYKKLKRMREEEKNKAKSLNKKEKDIKEVNKEKQKLKKASKIDSKEVNNFIQIILLTFYLILEKMQWF